MVKSDLNQDKDKGYFRQSLQMLNDASPMLSNAPRLLLTKKGRMLLNLVFEWKKRYLDIQDATSEKPELYYVHTDLDEAIPFRPSQGRKYNIIIVHLVKIANRLVSEAPAQYVEDVMGSFIYGMDISKKVFEECPTIMPRLKEHKDLNLKFVQRYDQPVNCCPSFHIMFSLLAYNLGKEYLSEEELIEVAQNVGEMANSVLYTKQHALVDVSFGILAARMAYAKYFPEPEFDDLTYLHPFLKPDNPLISYDEINRLYKRGLELRGQGLYLADIVKTCLDENGYKKVKGEEMIGAGK